ncbi:hypothetical protein PIIN_08775 [Serendipita indica DSM 11827]|uniref:Uncharacterized protein n=1 Tax=Serendipita indica (strain DSM 11827) TaxID=1109443 RepID=G4TU13_SERID|nr:hypothetical protein PIIN_08775 [Serendipita indica DSM 11827]
MQWWLSCLSGGGSSHRTKGNNTEASFSFRGSSVTWYTRTAPDGGIALVYIDEALPPTRINTYSPVVDEAKPIFSRANLDPSTTHKITVQYDASTYVETNTNEKFVDVCYFEYDDSGGSGGSGASAPATTISGSTSSSSSSSGTRSTSTTASSISSSRTGTSGTTSLTGTLSNGQLVSLESGVGHTASVAGGQSAAVGNVSQGGGGGSGVPVSALVGFALGVVFIGALLALFWFWRRRKRRAAWKSRHFTDSKEEIRREPDLTVAPTRDSAEGDSLQQYEMRIPEKLRRQQPFASPYNADPFASTNSLGDQTAAGGSSSRRNLPYQDSYNDLNNPHGHGYLRSPSNVGSGTMNTDSSPTTDRAPPTPVQNGHAPVSPNSYQESSWPLPEGSATHITHTPAMDEKRVPATATVSPFDSFDNTGTTSGTEYLSSDRRRAVERSSMGTSYRTPTPPPQYVR